MTKIVWDNMADRTYETGVSQGVLYRTDANGAYSTGFAWNGLTGVTESPSGAEASPMYADNMKYLNLISVEQLGGTIQAFTYPDEFAECDGSLEPIAGVRFSQQNRKMFGLSYRTLLGNAIEGTEFGYRLHLVYGAMASPTEKAYNTVNESPEAMPLSWTFTTTPVEVTISDTRYKPVALITIDSNTVDPAKLASFEDILYGTSSLAPRLPLPGEVVSLLGTGVTLVTPTKPTYVDATRTITRPNVTGLDYFVNDAPMGATFVIPAAKRAIVTAVPKSGYGITDGYVTIWDYPAV